MPYIHVESNLGRREANGFVANCSPIRGWLGRAGLTGHLGEIPEGHVPWHAHIHMSRDHTFYIGCWRVNVGLQVSVVNQVERFARIETSHLSLIKI